MAVAQETGLFQMTFASGTSKPAVVAFLRGEQTHASPGRPPPQTLVERIRWKAPYPLLRHHFGRPTVDETVAGVVDIARAECLDVLSLGTDQNAQEHFFRPAEMDPSAHGAGGVPVRTEADLAAIYAHTRLGNYPLMRCYSGTRDTMQWAPMLAETINNAWCAIPLFWYTQLDGRSPRPLARGDSRNAGPDALARRARHPGRDERIAPLEPARRSRRGGRGGRLSGRLQRPRSRRAELRPATDVQQSAEHFADDGPGQDAGQARPGGSDCKTADSRSGARRAAA